MTAVNRRWDIAVLGYYAAVNGCCPTIGGALVEFDSLRGIHR